MANLKTDSDVQVTFEDQQAINKFARFNARLQDLKEELSSRKKALQNLEDAGDELMMADTEDDTVPYLVGECFFQTSTEKAEELLTEAKQKATDNISAIEVKVTAHQEELDRLKATLYAKFGNNINLEADDPDQ